MRPRRFYLGFPPRDREDDAQRDRVRHRRDPARRLREDPRDAPAGAGRRRRPLRPGARAARRSSSAPVAAAEARARRRATRPAAPRRSRSCSARRRRARARASERGMPGDLDGARARRVLAPDDVEARSRSSSPGRRRTSPRRHPLRGLFMVGGGKATTTVDSVLAEPPGGRDRPAAGRRDPRRRTASPSRRPRSPRRSPASKGKPVDARRPARPAPVTLGPVRPQQDRRRLPARLRPPRREARPRARRAWQSVKLTGVVTRRDRQVARPASSTAQGRKDISSPVGIVQALVQSAAAEGSRTTSGCSG